MIFLSLKQPEFDSKNYKNLSEVSIFPKPTMQNLKYASWRKGNISAFFSKENLSKVKAIRCAKSVRIRSFCGSCSVQMGENTDQKNSEYGHFLPSD